MHAVAVSHTTELAEAVSGLAADAEGLLGDLVELTQALHEQNPAGGWGWQEGGSLSRDLL